MIGRLAANLIISCSRIEEFVYDYAEGRLGSFLAMRFESHLSLCRTCREYVLLYKAAADAKAFRQLNPAPGELLDATLDFLAKEGLIDAGGRNNAEDGKPQPPADGAGHAKPRP